MCSYEKAWRPRELSPWCAVFSQHDLEVRLPYLQYIIDAYYYVILDFGVSGGFRVLLRRRIRLPNQL